jgi:hypothetical protein
LGQIPYFYSPFVASADVPVSRISREKLILPEGESQFETLLNSLIPEQIPRVYLE